MVVTSIVSALLAATQPYGADTCVSGFVWREATVDDHVCVIPEVREQARRDNAQAKYRVSLSNHAYGPDTCRSGYVWREATYNDHVCVLPSVRDQAHRDNAAAASRYVNQ